MLSKLITLMILFAVELALLGCPAGGGGGGGGGEGQGGEQPSNSVMIENISDTSADRTPVTIGEVHVSLSGTTGVSENIIVEPIAPGEDDLFCCFADGVYDVRVVIESGEDGVDLNNTFEGPFTYRFLVRIDGGQVHVFN